VRLVFFLFSWESPWWLATKALPKHPSVRPLRPKHVLALTARRVCNPATPMVSLGALVSAKRNPTLARSVRPVSATVAPQAKDNKPVSAITSGAFVLARAVRPTPKKAVIVQRVGWAARHVMPMARDIPRVIVRSVGVVKTTPKAVNAQISKRAYRLVKTQNGAFANNAAWSTTSAAPREISKTALAPIRLQVFACAKRT